MSKKRLRQGDALSCDLFSVALENIVRNSMAKCRGTIFHKSVQLLAYADDTDVIGRAQRGVNEVIGNIETEEAKLGLTVNEGKTKYMLSSRKDTYNRCIGQNVTMGSNNFEVVKDFVYLGSAGNDSNVTSAEIERRITLANRCFFGIKRQLSSRALERPR